MKSSEIGAKRPAVSSAAAAASSSPVASPAASPTPSPAPSPAASRASRASASHRSSRGLTQWWAVSSSAGGDALEWAAAGDVARGGAVLSRLPEQMPPSISSATTPRAARAHRDRHATSTMQLPDAPTRLRRRAEERGAVGYSDEGWGGAHTSTRSGVAHEAC